jgi:hypothetical protein
MAEATSDKMSLDDSLKEAQLEKVRLEIEQLRKTRLEGITRYLPLLSVLIAVGGFLFGIYQFQKQSALEQKQSALEQNKIVIEQQKDRETRETDQALRIKAQIRSDLEQLFLFTQEKKQTISTVRFIIEDLKDYLEIEKSLNRADSKPHKTRDITINLIQNVVNDCDFNQIRDVIFARTVMSDWEDSIPYLKEQPSRNTYILTMYSDALETIYSIDSQLVRSMKYDGNLFMYQKGYGKLGSSQIDHLEQIVLAFKDHVQLLAAGEIKSRYIVSFQAATCNPTLTEQLFGVKFDPKANLRELGHCPDGN